MRFAVNGIFGKKDCFSIIMYLKRLSFLCLIEICFYVSSLTVTFIYLSVGYWEIKYKYFEFLRNSYVSKKGIFSAPL